MQSTPRPSTSASPPASATKRPSTRRATAAKGSKPERARKVDAPHASPPRGSGPAASSIDTWSRDEMIRQAAWSFYEQRGCVDGYDLEDWLSAEALVTQRLALDGPDHSPRDDRITE